MKPQTSLHPIPREVAVRPKSLASFWDEVNDLFKKVEKRAYELFEWRGAEHGRDLEDWFKAENELFKAMPLEISEQENALLIRAEVPGFKAEELEINLEPGFVTIKGHQAKQTESTTKKTYYSESKTQDVFRKMALPFAVLPDSGEATLKDGVLEIKVSKAGEAKKVEIAAA